MLLLLSIASAEPRHAVEGSVQSCAVSSDGSLLLAQTRVGDPVAVFSTETGANLHTLTDPWLLDTWQLKFHNSGLPDGFVVWRVTAGSAPAEQGLLIPGQPAVLPLTDRAAPLAPGSGWCRGFIPAPGGGWYTGQCTADFKDKPVYIDPDGKVHRFKGGKVGFSNDTALAMSTDGRFLALQNRLYDTATRQPLVDLIRPGAWSDQSDTRHPVWLGESTGLWWSTSSDQGHPDWSRFSDGEPIDPPFELPAGQPCAWVADTVVFSDVRPRGTWLTAVDMTTGEQTPLESTPPENSWAGAVLTEIFSQESAGREIVARLRHPGGEGDYAFDMRPGRVYTLIAIPESPDSTTAITVTGTELLIPPSPLTARTIPGTDWSALTTEFGSPTGGPVRVQIRSDAQTGLLAIDTGEFEWHAVPAELREDIAMRSAIETAYTSSQESTNAVIATLGEVARTLSTPRAQPVMFAVVALEEALDAVPGALVAIHTAKMQAGCADDAEALIQLDQAYIPIQESGHRLASTIRQIADADSASEWNARLDVIKADSSDFLDHYQGWLLELESLSACGLAP